MNKDINIVLNSTDVVAAAFDVADGVVTVDDFQFPWKKIQKMTKTAAVTGAGGAITLTPDTPSAGVEYGFTITQTVADVLHVSRVGYVAVAGDTPTTVCDNLRTLLQAMENAGRLDVTLTGTTTCVITASDDNAIISVGGLIGLSSSPASGIAGTAAVNDGGDLLAEGIVDSFDGTLPQDGLEYTSWEFELMLPKGSGGFNEQTSDQAVSLVLYLDEAGTAYAALNTEIQNVADGLNPSGTGSEELLGQD